MAGSPARKEVGRVGVKVVPDTSEFGKKLDAELAKYAKKTIDVKVTAETKAFEAELKRVTSGKQSVDIKVRANTAAAEAQIKKTAASRTTDIRLRILGDEATRRLAAIDKTSVKQVQVNLDDKAARVRLDVISQDRRVALSVDVDQSNLKQVQAWTKSMGAAFSDVSKELEAGVSRATARLKAIEAEKIRIQVEVDAAKAEAKLKKLAEDKQVKLDLDAVRAEAKIKQITRTETKRVNVDVDRDALSGLMQSLGGVVVGVLGGITGAVGQVTSSFGSMGSSGTSALNGLSSSGGALSGVLGQAGTSAAGLVSSLISMGGTVVIITAVVVILGALITAAAAAAIAIASVLIGVAALVAIPLIFAGVVALISGKNTELGDSFKKLSTTLKDTLGKVAQPVVEVLAGAMTSLNSALQKGTPLYSILSAVFSQAAAALKPLVDGLGDFALNTLGGLRTALDTLNKGGFFAGIGASLGTMGTAFGSFFSSLAVWSPAFQKGFDSIANAALKLSPSIANLMGSFASFSPGVIDTLASAFTKLFDSFSNNSDVYGAAAQSFADALDQMAGPLASVAAAFARMAPEIMAGIAAAVTVLADKLSDPATVQGLTNLATGLIDLATAAAGAAVDIAATVGTVANDFAVMGDSIDGTLKDTASVSTAHLLGLVTQANNTQEAAKNLQRQLTLSFGQAVSDSVNAMHDMGTSWSEAIAGMDETTQAGSIKINQGFQTQFLGLLNTVKFNGTAMDAEWVKTFDALIATTAASGDPIAQRMSMTMEGMLNVLKTKGPEGIAQVKTMIEGMGGTVEASQLASLMGIKMDETNAKVKAGAATAQQTITSMGAAFADIIKTSKTPEEMSTRLDAMNTVINAKATAGATAFAKLPDGMAKTLAAAKVAPEVATLMTAVTTAITTGVTASKTAFTALPKAMSSVVVSDGTIKAGITAQMTGVTTAIKTGVTNATTTYKLLPTQMNAATVADKTPATVDANMKKVVTNIKSGVTTAVASFKNLAVQAQSYGRLTGFTAAVAGAMTSAKSSISGAVSSMVASLARLNTTFKGPTISAPTVLGGGTATASSLSGATAMTSTTPMALAGFSMMAKSIATMGSMGFTGDPVLASLDSSATAFDSLAEVVGSYSRNLMAREAQAPGQATVQKVYNITVVAAPNVPTEESLRKQLSYADTLYQ